MIYEIISCFQEDSYIEKKVYQNLKFLFPIKSQAEGKALFDQEPETLEWIDTFQNDKKIIFWDIGANIGIYSIYALQSTKTLT